MICSCMYCRVFSVSTAVAEIHHATLTQMVSTARWALAAISAATALAGVAQNTSTLSIDLQALWQRVPFAINVLESVFDLEPELYPAVIDYIAGTSEDDEQDDNTDRGLHNYVQRQLNSSTASLLDFALVYRTNTPRVQAHYQHYQTHDLDAVKMRCTRTSFGVDPADDLTAWLEYNDKVYCSPDDVFALRTDTTLSSAKIYPFDRVIGDKLAPLYVLYGDIESETCRNMLKNVHLAAKLGKLSYMWRYIPPTDGQFEPLAGYGVDVSFKDTDYIAIDDRHIPLSLRPSRWHLSKLQLQDLGLRMATSVLKDSPLYEKLVELLQNFPHHLAELADELVDENVRTRVAANEKVGLTQDSIGIFVNGAPVSHLELDVFTLAERVQNELALVETLRASGFTARQAKHLVSKFALLSAVKQGQFQQGDSIMGTNSNRYKLYQHLFNDGESGGVIYFNDIERDENYDNFPTNTWDAYTGESLRKLRQGQIPPLRVNVHEIVFAINVADKEQLRMFFSISKLILDRSLPQQLGLLPLPSADAFESKLILKLYALTAKASPKETLALLYKYFECESTEAEQKLLATVESLEYSQSPHAITSEAFSLGSPSVIINGVIADLRSPTWQTSIGKQLSQDVRILLDKLASLPKSKAPPLRAILYESAKTKRNLKIVPTSLSSLKYKGVSREMLARSTLFGQRHFLQWSPKNFWLVGNLNTLKVRLQLVEILRLMLEHPEVQVRVIHTGQTEPQYLKDRSDLTAPDIHSLIKLAELVADEDTHLNHSSLEMLARNNLPLSHSFILFNSRYVRLDQTMDTSELDELIDFETGQRIGIIEGLFGTYPGIFELRSVLQFNNQQKTGLSDADWFDFVTSVITKSFYVDDNLYLKDVARFDFNMLDMGNSFATNDEEKQVDILLIIDPIDEFAQKVVSVVRSVMDFNFVSVRFLLQPNLLPNDEINIKRFYRGQNPRSIVRFDSEGSASPLEPATLELPREVLLSTDLDVPSYWIAVLQDAPLGVDLANLQLSEAVSCTFSLKDLVVEGFAKEIKTASAPTGLELEVVGQDGAKDTTVMSTLGYFQFQVTPGLWEFRIKPGTASEEHYALLSATSQQFDCNVTPLQNATLAIFKLNPRTIKARVDKKPGYDSLALDRAVVNQTKLPLADINIFTVVSGHLYERFLSIMTASVRAHTKHSIKFWIIENYVSPDFRKLLPSLAAKYQFDYQLITYKWPKWLRQQRDRQRTIWGYKILFLDVIFPQELDRVIYVDADQVVRTDMKELMDEDLQECVYGFTPMCDSRPEVEGFRFWKQGYWAKVLGEDLKYHISALFVVDLARFRETQAGNRIRMHYQKLSSDPGSLSNLDQDLPNNLQRLIPIHSLLQDWLWCETWCADNELALARTIDLCNNPLTKEPKLDRARRQIPEWTTYDSEISELRTAVREQMVDENQRQEARQKEEQRNQQEDVASDDDGDYYDEL